MAESKMTEIKMAAIIKLSQNEQGKFFVQNGWIQLGRIHYGCHHLVNWIELVWVRVRVEEECFWVNLREDNKVFESKMAVSESDMAEFKMAAIIKLSQNEQVKFILCKMVESKMTEIRMAAIIKLSQNEEGKFFVQNGWIQLGRIHYGCHHLVNRIELVWVRVRVRVEWECFWVNLREDNKVSESKMAVSESDMAEFRMAAIIKLSRNEWVKFFFVQIVGTSFGKCEWLWEEKLRWLNPRWPNSRWLPSSS